MGIVLQSPGCWKLIVGVVVVKFEKTSTIINWTIEPLYKTNWIINYTYLRVFVTCIEELSLRQEDIGGNNE